MAEIDRIPRVGVMNVFNEAEYVEYSIRSVIGCLDQLIVIYGWFAETKRGTDNLQFDDTYAILERLQNEFGVDKINLSMCSGVQQLVARNQVWARALECGWKDYWLWIIDGDEVYDSENLGNLMKILHTTKAEGVKIDSLTFVNDFKSFVKIAFPRLFRIQPGNVYNFVAPNDISLNGRPMEVTNYEDQVKFFHYSYCKSSERFMLKKREREALPGGRFKWYLDEYDRVTADGINIRTFTGRHPAIIKSHPRFRVRGGRV